MKEIDFFISYSHNDEAIVKDLVDTLEKGGAKCWYAPRDVMGRYAKAIVDAIGRAKIFLLCLSSSAAVSDQVLNEVEMAYKKNRTSDDHILIEPLCIEPLDLDAPEFDEIMYYIRRINFIQPQNLTSPSTIAQEVINKNQDFLNLSGSNIKKEKPDSHYFTDEAEEARLTKQNQFMRRFDEDVYKEIFDSFGTDDIDILDIGCGNGGLLFDRLDDFQGHFRLIGLDRDPAMIQEATDKYKNEHVDFMVCDLEQNDLIEELKKLMDQLNIEKFDFIHISMILLHLKSPTKLLRKLHRLLKPNGVLFIKDIDDGLNFAYPDDKNEFEHIYRICEIDETSGDRSTGRQIFPALISAGFNDVSLRKSGFTTIGLSEEEKETFWNMYFKFILDDIEMMHEKYPDNADIAKEYEWYSENYNEIFEDFMQNDFVFSLGFQIYLAKK